MSELGNLCAHTLNMTTGLEHVEFTTRIKLIPHTLLKLIPYTLTVWRLTKLTQIDEEYSPAKTGNEPIMTREYASSYADRHPGDVK